MAEKEQGPNLNPANDVAYIRSKAIELKSKVVEQSGIAEAERARLGSDPAAPQSAPNDLSQQQRGGTPEPPAVQILTREIVLNLRLECMETVGNEQAPPELSLIDYGALGPGSISPDLRSSLGIPNPPDFPRPPQFRAGESEEEDEEGVDSDEWSTENEWSEHDSWELELGNHPSLWRDATQQQPVGQQQAPPGSDPAEPPQSPPPAQSAQPPQSAQPSQSPPPAQSAPSLDLSLINYGALGPGSISPDLRSSLGIPNPPDFPDDESQQEEEDEWDEWDDEAEWDAEGWWQPPASPLGSDPSVQSDSSQQQHSGPVEVPTADQRMTTESRNPNSDAPMGPGPSTDEEEEHQEQEALTGSGLSQQQPVEVPTDQRTTRESRNPNSDAPMGPGPSTHGSTPNAPRTDGPNENDPQNPQPREQNPACFCFSFKFLRSRRDR
ncbi:hypothetical protein LguiB_026338 [Lonicera macranthoides]